MLRPPTPSPRTRRSRLAHVLVVLAIALSLLAVAGAPAGAEEAPPEEQTSGTALQEATPGVRDSIVRAYLATFARTPDLDGLDYWVGRYLDGLGLDRIADAFMASPEWASTYGELGDGAFIDLLYRNVLDRDPDDAGRAYWGDKLARGHLRRTVLLGFSESAEFVSDTGTAAPESPPAPRHPLAPAGSGQGRRIIYGNSAQRVWMIDARDRIVDSYLVSGRRATPGPGHYSVFSKSETAWAGHDGITMKWMVRFAHGSELAIGFHAIPRRADGSPLQSESQLGTYRSAGCVRQADHKAKALYDWAPLGTPVVVLA